MPPFRQVIQCNHSVAKRTKDKFFVNLLCCRILLYSHSFFVLFILVLDPALGSFGIALVTAGQCFDDEGVVLSDFEDHRLLSPRILLKDIMRGVPNKENISVVVGEDVTEIRSIKRQAEGCDIITVNAEEAVNVPREVCYPIERNILGIPQKHLRKKILFKLPQGYELFKQSVSKQANIEFYLLNFYLDSYVSACQAREKQLLSLPRSLEC